MQGRSHHALLDRTVQTPAQLERDQLQELADPSHEEVPNAGEVLREAAFTIAAFLLIAVVLRLLVIWIHA